MYDSILWSSIHPNEKLFGGEKTAIRKVIRVVQKENYEGESENVYLI
jgi:hypothetical protein